VILVIGNGSKILKKAEKADPPEGDQAVKIGSTPRADPGQTRKQSLLR